MQSKEFIGIYLNNQAHSGELRHIAKELTSYGLEIVDQIGIKVDGVTTGIHRWHTMQKVRSALSPVFLPHKLVDKWNNFNTQAAQLVEDIYPGEGKRIKELVSVLLRNQIEDPQEARKIIDGYHDKFSELLVADHTKHDPRVCLHGTYGINEVIKGILYSGFYFMDYSEKILTLKS